MGIILSVDYAFKIAEEADETTAPVLIVYEHKTGSIWAIEVDHKGADLEQLRIGLLTDCTRQAMVESRSR